MLDYHTENSSSCKIGVSAEPVARTSLWGRMPVLSNAERRDSPHPTALQKGAGIATQDYLDSLNEEEREIYLAELTEHMNVRRLAELVIRYTIENI